MLFTLLFVSPLLKDRGFLKLFIYYGHARLTWCKVWLVRDLDEAGNSYSLVQ